MFTLQDGREHLYQWDLDRYIIVEDNTICEVHFCNRTSDCSLVVEVKDGLAPIPNILLQDARPIRVYAYVDDKYTLTEEQFTVKSRTRPDDYVYTETETLQYSALDARVRALEENIEGVVKDEVNKFMEENPPQVDLSDYYTKGETDTAIQTAVDAIDIPEVDFTGYATEQYVDDAIANLDIPEVDLSDYYTKSQVDNKFDKVSDSYYLDFSKGVLNQPLDATPEMIEFAEHLAGQDTTKDSDACAYIKDTHDNIYYPAIVSYGWTNGTFRVVLTKAGVNLNLISVGNETAWDICDISMGTDGKWKYQILGSSSFTFASKDDIANAGGGSGGSCNIPLISHNAVDISTVGTGIYAINSAQYALSCVQCSEINATINLQWWVSNGMLLIRDKNVVAWGQDYADIMFYVIDMTQYQDQTVTLAPTSSLKLTGWEGGMSGGGEVDLSNYYTKEECDQQFNTAPIYEAIPSDDHINELIDAKLGVIENGSY